MQGDAYGAAAAHPLLRTPRLEGQPQLLALGGVVPVTIQALPELVPGPPARLPLLHRWRRHLRCRHLRYRPEHKRRLSKRAWPPALPRAGCEPSPRLAASTAGPDAALPAVPKHRGRGVPERREGPGPRTALTRPARPRAAKVTVPEAVPRWRRAERRFS